MNAVSGAKEAYDINNTGHFGQSSNVTHQGGTRVVVEVYK